MKRLALLLLAACAGPQTVDELPCDVLVVGGSFGGCAAALGAAEAGADVWLVEETDWIGGQVTSQGVSALDEHSHIETFGGTRNYYRFREGVRKLAGAKNPGGGWVSRLCFEPHAGLAVLEKMLEAGVKILTNTRVTATEMRGDRILSVTAGRRFRPKIVIDATDTGELAPLVGAEFELAERPQAMTWCFAVEHRPGENHTIGKPEGYERFRGTQPFTLDHFYEGKGRVRYGMFKKLPGTPGSFFDYRKIGPNLALINWPGNDYRGRDPEEAKRLSMAFLYWLQTECSRDEGGRGYPELKLQWFAKRPYIREGRRLVTKTRIVTEDLVTKGARGRLFEDSIGVGWYGIDLHSRVGDPDDTRGRWVNTKPFQIPWGALVPVRLKNLLPGCKNIGTTSETNGAYRLHPVEWAIGEASGRAAAMCARRGVDPADLPVRELQVELLEAGAPIFWWIDVPVGHPDFVALQAVSAWGLVEIPDRLAFDPAPERLETVRRLFRNRR